MTTFSDQRPESLSIERTHDNRLIARFVENIVEKRKEDGELSFEYDEFIYDAPWSDALERRIRLSPQKFLTMVRVGVKKTDA